MKYPASHLTPFLAILPREAPSSGCYRSLTRLPNECYKCSPFNTLRALELSCLSFSISGYLFSMACALFLQNTRGRVSPSDTWTFRGNRFLPVWLANRSISVLSVPLWQENLPDLHNF